MMIGILGFAILAGFFAGGGALVLGLGVWVSLAIYAGTGALVLLCVVTQALVSAMNETRDMLADGPISISSGARKRR